MQQKAGLESSLKSQPSELLKSFDASNSLKYDYTIKIKPGALKAPAKTETPLVDFRKGEICFAANFSPADIDGPPPETPVRNMVYSIDQSAKRTRINSANATAKNRIKSAVRRNVNQ